MEKKRLKNLYFKSLLWMKKHVSTAASDGLFRQKLVQQFRFFFYYYFDSHVSCCINNTILSFYCYSFIDVVILILLLTCLKFLVFFFYSLFCVFGLFVDYKRVLAYIGRYVKVTWIFLKFHKEQTTTTSHFYFIYVKFS